MSPRSARGMLDRPVSRKTSRVSSRLTGNDETRHVSLVDELREK